MCGLPAAPTAYGRRPRRGGVQGGVASLAACSLASCGTKKKKFTPCKSGKNTGKGAIEYIPLTAEYLLFIFRLYLGFFCTYFKR